MKNLLIIAFSCTLPFVTFATETDRCKSQAKKELNRALSNGTIRSDVQIIIDDKDKGELILAGETSALPRLGTFTKDQIVYTVSGSYHSGYFTDALIFDAKTCKFESLINIYGE